jgi:hypothetical protein
MERYEFGLWVLVAMFLLGGVYFLNVGNIELGALATIMGVATAVILVVERATRAKS